MKKLIIIIIIIITLCTTIVYSQTFEDAISTINIFCAMDSAGYRLLEKYDAAEIARFALNYSVDSRHGYNIITGYHVVRCIVQGNSAQASVVFYSAASTNPFVIKDQDIWQTFELRLNDQNKWLIVSYVGIPKISIPAYMTILRSNLKSEKTNEQDIPEINRKIQNLTAIKVSPRKERYPVDPMYKDLEVGLSEDEIDIPIDSTIIMHKDMTFDGRPDMIVFRVRGESQTSPYNWSMNIVDGEKSIFNCWVNFIAINGMFYNKDYFKRANSYIDAKREYYFKTIPQIAIQYSDFRHADYIFDKNNINSAYRMVQAQLLNKFDINKNEAERIAENILEKIRNGVHYLHIPIGQGRLNPMIYIEELGTFVVFLGN